MSVQMEKTQTQPVMFEPCDRCGARSLFRVTLPSGLDLTFCGHDFNAAQSSGKMPSYVLQVL